LLLNRAESVASNSRKADGQVLAKSTYGLMLNQKGGGDADLLRRAVKDDAQGDEPTEKGTESLLRPFKPRVAGNSGGIGPHKILG
jgi:hypothetical protein